jgi:hypothetical protein
MVDSAEICPEVAGLHKTLYEYKLQDPLQYHGKYLIKKQEKLSWVLCLVSCCVGDGLCLCLLMKPKNNIIIINNCFSFQFAVKFFFTVTLKYMQFVYSTLTTPAAALTTPAAALTTPAAAERMLGLGRRAPHPGPRGPPGHHRLRHAQQIQLLNVPH